MYIYIYIYRERERDVERERERFVMFVEIIALHYINILYKV